MTAQIIELSAWKASRPEKAVSVRVSFDPFWWPRFWLAMWGIR